MAKTILMLLAMATSHCLSDAVKCLPTSKYAVKELKLYSLLGNWELVASKPESSEKCRNITVDTFHNISYNLHEDFFKKELYIWRRHSTKNYEIVAQSRPSPYLELKNDAWYSVGSKRFVIAAVDYSQYVVLYKCSKGLFSLSETVEIWGRPDLRFTPGTIPQEVKDVLAKFKISVMDLSYRKRKDCWHQVNED